MKYFLIEKIIKHNQDKLELLIKSHMISIKIKERMSAKNYRSTIRLIEEKSAMIREIERLDDAILESMNSLRVFGEIETLARQCDEAEKEKLALLKEISFKVLRQMESNKQIDEALVKELFEVLKDETQRDIFLKW